MLHYFACAGRPERRYADALGVAKRGPSTPQSAQLPVALYGSGHSWIGYAGQKQTLESIA